MSVPTATEKRALSQAELELVQQTHYPEICELPASALADAARRLRDHRDKARDRARQQRRELRGKAAARGASAARDDRGQARKGEILSGALKRVNRANAWSRPRRARIRAISRAARSSSSGPTGRASTRAPAAPPVAACVRFPIPT